MKNPVYLSVVVPLYNEARRLIPCLEGLCSELHDTYKYEIILVDNGSLDDTPRLVEQAERIYPAVRAIRLRDRGKGLAVRTGMLEARGCYRYMCDVDLSTPAHEIHRFLEYARRYDVVIGSRELDASGVVTDAKRRVMGRLFHALAAGAAPGVRDTQCGFKMFRACAAENIFGHAIVDGMAFDVEALSLASKMGFTVREISVPWVIDRDSRVRVVGDSLEMLLDVCAIRTKQMFSRITSAT